MASVASFYFAMFRRFQAICGPGGSSHVNPDSTQWTYLYGGFSLQSVQDAQGIFGELGPQASHYAPLSPGLSPLKAGSLIPAENPLWAMLNASLVPGATFGATVVVAGQTWPAMPLPPIDEYTIWVDANATAPRLIDAFGDWIIAGKIDDSPQDAPYNFASLSTAVVAPWPLKPQEYTSVLFVASMPNDDGRRHGDLSMPDPPANHVPANFWATSQIALTYPPGVMGQTAGTIANPMFLKPTEEYWVLALIGNASGTGAGTVSNPQYPPCTIVGDAQCFNTFTSPGTSLPSLDNIDPLGSNPTYEQFYMNGYAYDTVGFRFNVDAVFSQLATALTNQVPPAMLGNLPAAQWLKDGHPCVKVRIMSGEQLDHYPPAGNAPQPPKLDNPPSVPTVDRHIAQRNLAPFDPAEIGMKKIKWTNFIVAQAAAGWNELTLQSALPADAFHFYFAIPKAAYERWIDPRTSKGGVVRGLEVVTDVPSKPFPEAVILRQTGAVLIRIAEHAGEKERFFGMSLGIEGDPAGFKRARDSDVSVVHAAQEGGVVGGFTLRAPPESRVVR
ncbi:MAG TPA: hypothetical protein VK681_20395 [Reyranella sp.]|nr:hypothetical protein [Reyranella sp.]